MQPNLHPVRSIFECFYSLEGVKWTQQNLIILNKYIMPLKGNNTIHHQQSLNYFNVQCLVLIKLFFGPVRKQRKPFKLKLILGIVSQGDNKIGQGKLTSMERLLLFD